MQTKRISNHAITVNHATETRGKAFKENEWGDRHAAAWNFPRRGGEAAIKALIMGLAEYADQYHRAEDFEPMNFLGHDTYAGAYFLEMALATQKLLSMSIGRLDAGTLDSLIFEILKNEGFDTEKL